MIYRFVVLAMAVAFRAHAQSIVLHAARLLDVESGKILAPGELLVQGERISKPAPRSRIPRMPKSSTWATAL